MPRIAVAVAVVALVAFSIGFNTSRYTVVWDMVGGPSYSAQSLCAPHPAVRPQPTVAPQSEPAVQLAMAPRRPAPGPVAGATEHVAAVNEPAPKDAPDADCEDVSDRVSDEVSANIDYASLPDEAAQAVEVAAADEQPSGADEGDAESTREEVPEEQAETVAYDRPDRFDPSQEVRRLPPVDQVTPARAN